MEQLLLQRTSRRPSPGSPTKPPAMPSARIYHLSGNTRGPVQRGGVSFASTGAGTARSIPGGGAVPELDAGHGGDIS